MQQLTAAESMQKCDMDEKRLRWGGAVGEKVLTFLAGSGENSVDK